MRNVETSSLEKHLLISNNKLSVKDFFTQYNSYKIHSLRQGDIEFHLPVEQSIHNNRFFKMH